MTTHWSFSGNGNGYSGKVFAVFGVPVIMLLLHWFCLFITLNDKKQKNQNKKALGIIFWIVPFISLFSHAMIYAAALGKEINITMIIFPVIGIMTVIIGNYLPKTQQNTTLGIRISWTLNNEENWNKTHRFAGKFWVIGGLVLIFSVFLPERICVFVMLCTFFVIIVIPVLYSYYIYRQHKKEGISYIAPPKTKMERIFARVTKGVVCIIIIGTAILAFTGNIKASCDDTSVLIDADYWTDLKLPYDEIDEISCQKDIDTGNRTYGFGTPRLSLGNFQNEEFGAYTLYAYTRADTYIVITSNDDILVIGLKDSKSTEKLYDKILENMGN